MRSCLVDDLVVVDHRPVSAVDVQDPDAFLDLLWSLTELSDDIRWYYTDPGQPGLVGRCSIVLMGRWNAGGGSAEIPVGIVYTMRGNRFERMELYPAEATAEMDARVAELSAERAQDAPARS